MAKVTLQTPIKRDEETITEVSLRKPQAGELRGLQLTMVMNMDVDAMIKLLPRITDPALTPTEVGTMNLGDFSTLSFEVLDFFGGAMSAALAQAKS